MSLAPESELSSDVNFSPSKARQRLAEAKDWQYIDQWLSTKYEEQTPSFERNRDTLKALLALAAQNEAADEEAKLIAELERKALEELEFVHEADLDADILTALNGSLDMEGRCSLEAIATLSVALGSPSTDPERLGVSLVDLSKAEFENQQQAQRVSTLQEYLDSELSELRDMLAMIQSDAFATPTSLPQKTSEWNRGTRLLSAKSMDYRERLATISQTAVPSPSLQDVVNQEEDILMLKAQVTNLETRVKVFQGLPNDKELALLELERIMQELVTLKRSRDALFEGLVEQGGAGRKLGSGV